MLKLDREIARTILYAQIASDGGKGIDDIAHIVRAAYPVWKQGYRAKDGLLLKAICLINRSKGSDFRYFVARGDLCNSYLVYFNFKIEGRRYQVSFHTFGNVSRYVSKRHRYATSWDEKSSREAATMLANVYGL